MIIVYNNVVGVPYFNISFWSWIQYMFNCYEYLMVLIITHGLH